MRRLMVAPMLRAIAVLAIGLSSPARANDRDATRAEPVVTPAKVPGRLAGAIGAGFYLAGRTVHARVKPDPVHEVDEAFYIARLDRSGLREILREQEAGGAHRGGIGMVWATPTTLVTSDYGTSPSDRGAFSILTIAGTKVAKIEATTLREADWKLTDAEVLAGVDNIAVPLLTRSGEVWLGMCMKKHKGQCEHTRYLRVFGGPRATVDRKPAGVLSGRVSSVFLRRSPDNARPDVASGEDLLAGLPRLAAPPGTSVAIRPPSPGQRSGGFACKSPTATHTSPEDDIDRDPLFPTRPQHVRWVATVPPIFAVRGTVPDLDGAIIDYVEFYRACAARPMNGFRSLRPRIWAESVPIEHPGKRWIHHEWRISIDDTFIGSIAGDAAQLAVAPVR